MNSKKLLIIALLLLPSMLHAEQDDDFGVWTEVGMKGTKGLWSFGMDADYRFQEKDRWSMGFSAGYKPSKYFKVGASYSFMYNEKLKKLKDKTEWADENMGGTSPFHYAKKVGYNLTPKYWSARHRVSLDAVGTIKLWKWLRISLRERYQLTYMPRQAVEKNKYREEYSAHGDFDDNWEPIRWVSLDDVRNEWNAEMQPSEYRHVLRSRLKLEYDKKGCRYAPYLSTEFHNSLADGMLLEKIRSAVGLSYKISKHHEVNLSYILTADIYDDEDDHARLHHRMHAIGVGYSFDF